MKDKVFLAIVLESVLAAICINNPEKLRDVCYSLIRCIRTVRRLTNAINADDAWLPTTDAERATVSLQRADTAGAVTLQQSVAARFPTENPTISTATAATARFIELPFPRRPAVATETATTNAHFTLHKQSVSGELSTYANVSAAASAATATAAAATTSGLDHVPDIGQPECDTSLYTACPNRPELSIEWQSTGVSSIIQSRLLPYKQIN